MKYEGYKQIVYVTGKLANPAWNIPFVKPLISITNRSWDSSVLNSHHCNYHIPFPSLESNTIVVAFFSDPSRIKALYLL